MKVFAALFSTILADGLSTDCNKVRWAQYPETVGEKCPYPMRCHQDRRFNLRKYYHKLIYSFPYKYFEISKNFIFITAEFREIIKSNQDRACWLPVAECNGEYYCVQPEKCFPGDYSDFSMIF